MQRPPARPGDPLAAVDTPALVLDLDAFGRNVAAMASAARAHRVRLRPHAKAHKTPEIARFQIAEGAVGICCQKTDEAAAFVDAGIGDVLVTNEVVEPGKLARLAELARRARIGVLVDHGAAVAPLAAAARDARVTLDVYIEVDIGAKRCGIEPGRSVLPLAKAIGPHADELRLRGLHCYHGGAQHLRDPETRREAIEQATADVVRTRRALTTAGFPCEIVTGAGSGTWLLEASSGVWNELQPGSYAFMDVDYSRNVPGPRDLAFEHSLFVLASIMSVPAYDRAICDAGLKAFSFDSGPPRVHGRDDLSYAKGSDEHGVLAVERNRPGPALRERVRLVPGHVDPTFNLYDWVVGYRGDRVEVVWPVSARGALG